MSALTPFRMRPVIRISLKITDRERPAPIDTDHDGMPEEWETRRGLDPKNPADGARLAADGYSNLEHYLNSLVPTPKSS